MNDLPIPSVEEFAERKDSGYSDEQALQLATDLLFEATGLTSYPIIGHELRLVNEAIYHMAWYLQETHENQTEIFSPFSSERLGSYTYQKASAAVKKGNSTGVAWFDRAVEYFSNKNAYDEGGLFSTVSEQVFQHGFDPRRV